MMNGALSILEMIRRKKGEELLIPDKAISPDANPSADPYSADTNTESLIDLFRKQGHGPALQAYQDHLNNMPVEGKNSTGRKIAGGITAFLEGALGVAPKASDHILHGAYRQKQQDWKDADKPLATSAGLELDAQGNEIKIAKEEGDRQRDDAKTKNEQEQRRLQAEIDRAREDRMLAQTEQGKVDAKLREDTAQRRHDELMTRMAQQAQQFNIISAQGNRRLDQTDERLAMDRNGIASKTTTRDEHNQPIEEITYKDGRVERKPAKISDKEAEAQRGIQILNDDAETLSDLSSKHSDTIGTFAGPMSKFWNKYVDTNPEIAKMHRLAQDIVNTDIYNKSGKAIRHEEITRIKDVLADPNTTYENFKGALEDYRNLLAEKADLHGMTLKKKGQSAIQSGRDNVKSPTKTTGFKVVEVK